jgi:hypothetical protein
VLLASLAETSELIANSASPSILRSTSELRLLLQELSMRPTEVHWWLLKAKPIAKGSQHHHY